MSIRIAEYPAPVPARGPRSYKPVFLSGILETYGHRLENLLGDSVGARFEVREVLRFTARRKVVLAGRVLDGIARSGQTINLKLPDGLCWSAKIDSVEFVDRMFSESLIGLLCEERDPREASLYAELCPPGTVVELGDAAAA